jgi:hypothetical protein
MKQRQKDLINPFAHVLLLWERLVERMSDAELLEMRDACKAAGETNCWYAIGDAARILLTMVIAERARRAEKARNPT